MATADETLAAVRTAFGAWREAKPTNLDEVADARFLSAMLSILRDGPFVTMGDELADFEAGLRLLLEHDGRTVTAWVVVASTQRLDPDVVRVDVSPLSHSLDYAVSSGTPPEHALGLADALTSKLRHIARTSFVDEE